MSPLIDQHGRSIDYLRISVTDRCNLRCVYCMPPGGIDPIAHDAILRYEELLRVAQAAIGLGITKFRISGGEPLVRHGITSFLADLASLPGCETVALTTNGLLLEQHAKALATAGISTINVSIDTLSPKRMLSLCGGGTPEQVIRGIDAALEQNIRCKLNTVLLEPVLDELEELIAFAEQRNLPLRFIEYMPFDPEAARAKGEAAIGETRLRSVLASLGTLEPVPGPPGCGPSTYFRIGDRNVTIGLISAISTPFCERCNRLRLTADGRLKPCLTSDIEIDLRHPLRTGVTTEEIQSLLKRTAQLKPLAHKMDQGEGPGRSMVRIGG